VSVDTYLKRKRLSGYAVFQQDDVEVLIPPVLARVLDNIHVGLKSFLLWKSFSLDLVPVGDHLHGPA
jgi:hypothetical protein